MGLDERGYSTKSVLGTGLAGRCPRCAEGRMFQGVLAVTPKCEVCGLDYAFADSGEGPAVFVAMVAGFVVLGAALAVDVAYEPSLWVHVLVFAPLTLLVCLGLVRPVKGCLIAAQFKHKTANERANAS